MNQIDQRLLEMKLRLEINCSDAGVVSRVWEAIEVLDFGGLDAACLAAYSGCLSRADLIEWIKFGGSQLAPLNQRDILAQQEAAFKLELVKRMDTEDEEVDCAVFTKFGGEVVTEQRVRSAFDVAMSMKFGSDWDTQLKNPRGSQSSGTIKVFDGGLDAKNKPTFMSSSRQYGQTVISLKPKSVATHPSIEIKVEKNGTTFTKEVLVHEPLETSVECGIMLKEEFESLKVVSIPMSGSNGDIAGGNNSREIFMVGLVPYVRHRQCRCADGWINVGGEAVNLSAWNGLHGELSAYCSEAQDFSVMEAWMADCPNPLESYYSWKFPNKDSKKLAINAMAGVASSRLNKNGLAPKIFIPALDTIRQQQNCERFIQWNVDDQIRKLLGGTKLKSDVRTIKNVAGEHATNRVMKNVGTDDEPIWKPVLVPVLDGNGNPVLNGNGKAKMAFMEEVSTGFTDAQELDVSDWYDEIHEESGLTYLEAARKNLAKSWMQSTKTANREIRKQGERNVGKMYKSKSSKTRTGDKSTTVNGARCNVLTESTIHVEVTCPSDHVRHGFAGQVDAGELVDLFTDLGFDWMTFAAEELIAGFAAGSQMLTKDDRERMVKNYMIRLNDLSIESVYMDGDSPWLNIRKHCFPEDVTVLCRCINMEELNWLQKARQLVEDCGMDTSDMKQILTAYRKPKLFRKMFFDGKVRNQTWAGLK